MKYLSIIRYVLMVLSIIVVVMGGYVSENVDLLLRWMYIMLGLSVGCMILFSIYSLAKNPKSAVQSLIGLVAILVVAGVAYALSSDATVITPGAVYDNPTQLKIADTGLYMMYFLLAAAFLSIIVCEIRNSFR